MNAPLIWIILPIIISIFLLIFRKYYFLVCLFQIISCVFVLISAAQARFIVYRQFFHIYLSNFSGNEYSWPIFDNFCRIKNHSNAFLWRPRSLVYWALSLQDKIQYGSVWISFYWISNRSFSS